MLTYKNLYEEFSSYTFLKFYIFSVSWLLYRWTSRRSCLDIAQRRVQEWIVFGWIQIHIFTSHRSIFIKLNQIPTPIAFNRSMTTAGTESSLHTFRKGSPILTLRWRTSTRNWRQRRSASCKTGPGSRTQEWAESREWESTGKLG